MKVYILDTINKLQRFSENLDVITILCNKSWCVFNDSDEKEVYIFQEDGNLIISNCGKVTKGSWQYLSANKSIIINGNNQSYMLHPAFIDEVIFALNLDGTQQCVFMIDENNQKNFAPTTFSQLITYFQEKERKQIEGNEQKQFEESISDLRESKSDSDNILLWIPVGALLVLVLIIGDERIIMVGILILLLIIITAIATRNRNKNKQNI